jgi:hypothetical protein
MNGTGMNGTGQLPPKRVRVTSPRRNATVRGPVRPLTEEIDERTALGEIYMEALVRAQLRLGATVLAATALLLGGLPLLFLAVPATSSLRVWQVPLPWLVLGVLVYPVVLLAARYYVRHSERVERDFADLVARR